MVIVRKQVQSKAAAGVAAKIQFKAKRPYRVVEPARWGSYKLQKLPFCQGLGCQGCIIKESAARMEKILSTLVIRKKTDGVDAHLATL